MMFVNRTGTPATSRIHRDAERITKTHIRNTNYAGVQLIIFTFASLSLLSLIISVILYL